MNITGTQTIDAPRLAVWQALNDADVLKRCLPGCESVERISSEEFRIVMLAAVGPLRARFNGFGKGTASVTLNEAAAGTELVYAATAQIGGKLAQVGSRLIDSVARKMSDDFFTEFRMQFAVPEVPTVTDSPGEAADETAGKTTLDGPIKSPAAADAPRVASQRTGIAAPEPRVNLVPGSWLAVAVTLGAAIAIAAMRLGH
jgi:carbon monoxide dehydrogenase subunit G